MKQVTLKFFIVPNSAWVNDGVSGNGSCSAAFDYYHMKQFVNDCRAVEKHGINCDDITVSDMWTQVWIVGPEEDNCGSHGYAENNPLRAVAKKAPLLLPVKFIEKFAADGDIVKTVCEYDRDGHRLEEPIEISWVAAQGEFRYRRFGSISDTLARVVEACKSYRDDSLASDFEKFCKALAEKR